MKTMEKRTADAVKPIAYVTHDGATARIDRKPWLRRCRHVVRCQNGGAFERDLRLSAPLQEESSVRNNLFTFSQIRILLHLSLNFGTTLAYFTSVLAGVVGESFGIAG